MDRCNFLDLELLLEFTPYKNRFDRELYRLQSYFTILVNSTNSKNLQPKDIITLPFEQFEQFTGSTQGDNSKNDILYHQAEKDRLKEQIQAFTEILNKTKQ